MIRTTILLKDLLDTMKVDTPFILKGMAKGVKEFTFETERLFCFNAFSKLPDSVLDSPVVNISIKLNGNQPIMVIIVNHI